jgi:hypothetical protein
MIIGNILMHLAVAHGVVQRLPQSIRNHIHDHHCDNKIFFKNKYFYRPICTGIMMLILREIKKPLKKSRAFI